MRVTWSGVSAGLPGEEHVLLHLKPELQLRSKKADGVRVFGGPRHEDAGSAGLGVSGGGALALGRRWREADAAGFALATGEKS